ncbi:MAG: hypothetical protein JWQ27_841 [Ferruginibacter sp.]|nr:hypothetical protein [Ferruginibacter sp.]
MKKVLYRITHWETWHYLAKYIPLSPAWLWYCLRARSMWFFTPSNPSLAFGGFEGETKKEMYDQLPPGSFPRSIYIDPQSAFDEVEKNALDAGYNYPFVVKPDAGMMGFMFRKIYTADDLQRYHAAMPVQYIIQEMIAYPLEVSVFYYRHPGQQKGTITGFLKKEFLEVTGDGQSSLLDLIVAYPRVQFRLEEMKNKHKQRLNDILPEGEPFILSPALNLSRGGRLISLEQEKDDKLLQVFDQLSHYTKQFYYGRYDIKCKSVESLKRGEDFSILEYNGCGAEPHHIYGNGNSLFEAYRIVLQHWKMLYKISRYNHQQGIPYWSYRRGMNFLKAAKQHFKVLKALDNSFEL